MFPDAPRPIPLYADLSIDGNSSRGIGVLQKLRRREFSALAMAGVVLAPDLALSCRLASKSQHCTGRQNQFVSFAFGPG